MTAQQNPAAESLRIQVVAAMTPIADRAGVDGIETTVMRVPVRVRKAHTIDGLTTMWTVNGSQEMTRREAVRQICRTFGIDLPSTGW